MSFRGTSMIFDGIACEELGLMMYEFDTHHQEPTKFASNLSVAEDRIDGRYRSLFYGGTVNEPLVFTIILCATEERARRNEPFDRWDLQKIASWLTGHTSYKWLSIVQPDLENIRFRCICSDLEAIEIAGKKWGFSFKVTCDSPFGYMIPETYRIQASASAPGSALITNKGTYNGFYYPIIDVTNRSSDEMRIEISNDTETSSFVISDIPTSANVHIDGENGIITSDSISNVYQYVSFQRDFHFPRLAKGANTISVSGAGIYEFTFEWPVNIGG